MNKVFQKEITIESKPRGFHLITDKILDKFTEISKIKVGMFSVFIKHTSASLTINENADPTVRMDFESHFNKMVPEDQPYYKHTSEGSDDMPAHLKTAILDTVIHIPISRGRLNLGIWQGIYLCEHRDQAGQRRLVLTAWGN